MPGPVPGIHVCKRESHKINVDGRDIGERSDAVLRTAMPGHDDVDGADSRSYFRHRTSAPFVSALWARCSTGFVARVRLKAVLIRARCEKACGKFPARRLAWKSYSSLKSPTSLRRETRRLNRASASARRPC